MVSTETGWGGDVEVTGDARTPGIPTYISNGEEQINIVPIDENDNGPNCDYAIQVEVDDAVPANSYLPADGDASSLVANGVFQTAATWTAVLAVTGLSGTSHYRFRVYSRNEDDLPTGGNVGAWSAIMIPNLDIAWSDWINASDTYDVTSGNTAASGVTLTGTQRTVLIAFTLTNKDATASSILAKRSVDGNDTFPKVVTQVCDRASYIIKNTASTGIAFVNSNPDTITDTNEQFVRKGFVADDSIEVNTTTTTNDGTFTIGTGGVVAGTITLIGGNSLTGEVVAVGNTVVLRRRAVTYGINITAKTIEASTDDAFFMFIGMEGETVTLINSEDVANDGQYVISAVTSKKLTLTTAPGANNTDDVTMTILLGDNIDNLTTSSTGTSHTIGWDTGTDLGNSYHGETVGIEITPYDDVSQGGSADTAAESSGSSTVNNVPNAPTLLTEIRGVSWDKDTTPEFIAEMSDIICGDALFFAISFYDGTTEKIYESDDDITGWWYEQDRDDAVGSTTPGVTTNWTAMTVDGIDKQYVPPIYQGQESKTTRNRVRFILPAASALSAGTEYTIKIKQGELRNVV